MFKIIRTTSDAPAFNELVQQLDLELWQRYPEVQGAYAPHNKIEKNNTVVVAFSGIEPVGCGCFKEHTEAVAEIKRMFVKREFRGKGIAANILSALCLWAHELGFKKAILETGLKQPEAISLYKKAGFELIPNYPPYTAMEQSVCMEKDLTLLNSISG